MRNRLQWLNMSELERQKAHSNLRSPEVIAFALMTNGELKDSDKDSVQINYFSYLYGVDIYSSKLLRVSSRRYCVVSSVAGGSYCTELLIQTLSWALLTYTSFFQVSVYKLQSDCSATHYRR